MQATKIKTDLAKNQTTQDKLNEALAADKEKLQDAQNRISALRAQIAERQTLVERKQRIDHECGEIAVYLGSRRGGLMTAGTFLIWQVRPHGRAVGGRGAGARGGLRLDTHRG